MKYPAICLLFLLTWAPLRAANLVVDATLPQGGDCATIGDWDAATETCRVADYVVAPGDNLRIASGTFHVVGQLRNEGLFHNQSR